MNGEDVMVCPFHLDHSQMLKKHDEMIHSLDKQMVTLKIIGSLQLVSLVTILVRLFTMGG